MTQYKMNLPDDLENGGLNPSSLLGAFLANHTAKRDKEKEKKTNATYGPKCYDLYMKFNPTSLWARMFLGYLIGMGDWYSTRCLLTWEVRGTMSHPWLYLRRRSMPHTEEIEFGLLLPTPTAMMDEAPIEKVDARNQKQMEKGNSPFVLGLGQQAMRGMLPTPNAYDWNTPRKEETFKKAQQRHKKKGVTLQNPLKQMASMGMLPTPTATDHKGAYPPTSINNNQARKSMLRNVYQHTETEYHSKTSQLNPRFVAEMMGYPPNWTELPFLNGEKNL